METNDEFNRRIRRKQQFAARLRLATERLEKAQRERVWAIVKASCPHGPASPHAGPKSGLTREHPDVRDRRNVRNRFMDCSNRFLTPFRGRFSANLHDTVPDTFSEARFSANLHDTV